MLPWIARDTIEVLGGSAVDDYGDTDATDWTSPTVLATVTGCSVQPVPAKEYLLGREAVESRWQVWTPPHATITHARRIRHNGTVYEVDGSVQQWADPTGLGLDHCTFFARRIDG